MKNLSIGKLYTNRHIENLKINTTGEGEIESITLSFKGKRHTVKSIKNDKYFQFYMDGCVKIGHSFLDEAIIDACHIMSTRKQVELIIYQNQTWYVQRKGMFTSVMHGHKKHLSFTDDSNNTSLNILADLARAKYDNVKYKIYGVSNNTVHLVDTIEKTKDIKPTNVLDIWLDGFSAYRGVYKHDFDDFLIVDYYKDDINHPLASKMPRKQYFVTLEDDNIYRAFIDEMELSKVDEGLIPSISIYFCDKVNLQPIARSVYDKHGQIMLIDDAYPKQFPSINIKDLQKA